MGGTDRGAPRCPDAGRTGWWLVMNTTTTPTSPLAAKLQTGGFVGRLVEPGDTDYDEARAGWNGAIDRRPAAVAYASDADDVAAAVRACREAGLDFTIRAGGHSVSGRSVRDGALCIDLRALNDVDVDAVSARRARRRRRSAWRAGRCDAGAQARGARRSDLAHRRRRAHARRRHRLAHASSRSHDRLAPAPPMSSWPTGGSCAPPTTSIPTCSGRCGAAAATSASSRPSSSAPTGSARWSSAGMLVYPWEQARDALRASA